MLVKDRYFLLDTILLTIHNNYIKPKSSCIIYYSKLISRGSKRMRERVGLLSVLSVDQLSLRITSQISIVKSIPVHR